MSIPTATWHDYPPAIEFEVTNLPLKVVRELAAIALNEVNIRMRRGEIMFIDEGHETSDQTYLFYVTPVKPMTRVNGPEIVTQHNDFIQVSERHQGLIDLAIRNAKLAELDAGKSH